MAVMTRTFTALAFVCAAVAFPARVPALSAAQWKDRFEVPSTELVATGRNDYFSLIPGQRSEFRSGDDRLVITVLDETRVIDGVTTRVVEERETTGTALVEVSRNFFAIDRRSHDVYYFGEEVDIYSQGRVTSHDGAWLSGRDGARFGMMMPAAPAVGQRYYQEVAPKVAMDRAEIVDLHAVVRTAQREFRDCLRVQETTPLERGVSYKWYARGVGLVQDDDLKLVATTPASEKVRQVHDQRVP